MANRLMFVIAAVTVLSLYCNAAHLTHEQHKEQHKEHVKAIAERHWNGTVTQVVKVGSKLADRMDDVLNKTAVKVTDTAQKMAGIKEGLVTKVSAALAQGSGRWTELRNKSSEKMARSQNKISAAKQRMHDKLAAGVEKLVETGNKLVNFTVGVVGKIVGQLVDKFQKSKSKMQEHKAEHIARINSVIQVGQVPVQEATTTESTTSPQPTYSY